MSLMLMIQRHAVFSALFVQTTLRTTVPAAQVGEKFVLHHATIVQQVLQELQHRRQLQQLPHHTVSNHTCIENDFSMFKIKNEVVSSSWYYNIP